MRERTAGSKNPSGAVSTNNFLGGLGWAARTVSLNCKNAPYAVIASAGFCLE